MLSDFCLQDSLSKNFIPSCAPVAEPTTIAFLPLHEALFLKLPILRIVPLNEDAFSYIEGEVRTCQIKSSPDRVSIAPEML